MVHVHGAWYGVKGSACVLVSRVFWYMELKPGQEGWWSDNNSSDNNCVCSRYTRSRRIMWLCLMEGISMKSRYPPSWVSNKEPPTSHSQESGDRTGRQTSNSYTNDVYSSYPSDCHYMFDRIPNYSSGLNQQIQSGLNQQIPPRLDQQNPPKLDWQFLSELNRNSDKKILQNSANQNNLKDFSQNQNLVRNEMNQRQHNAIDKSISLDDYCIKRRTEDHQNQFNGGTCKTASTKLISRDRRRTWSPPLFLESSQLRSTVAKKKPVDDQLKGRRYRSNDQINLNSKSQNNETVESFTSPPRIVPISGMLSSSVSCLNKIFIDADYSIQIQPLFNFLSHAGISHYWNFPLLEFPIAGISHCWNFPLLEFSIAGISYCRHVPDVNFLIAQWISKIALKICMLSLLVDMPDIRSEIVHRSFSYASSTVWNSLLGVCRRFSAHRFSSNHTPLNS